MRGFRCRQGFSESTGHIGVGTNARIGVNPERNVGKSGAAGLRVGAHRESSGTQVAQRPQVPL